MIGIRSLTALFWKLAGRAHQSRCSNLKISFISQALDAPLDTLLACARSLQRQTDKNYCWIVVVPRERTDINCNELKNILGNSIKIIRTGLSDAPRCLNLALESIDSDLVAPLDVCGVLAVDAVELIRLVFLNNLECDFLYTDEEYFEVVGVDLNASFKPAFNRHLLQSFNYLGSLTVMRTRRAVSLGLRAGFEGAASYDLMLRYLDAIPPERIRHMPRAAFTGPPSSAGFPDLQTARLAGKALAERISFPVSVDSDLLQLRVLYPVPERVPLVSIIIPTRDRADLLGNAVRTLVELTSYRAFQLIIVDNGSVEPETFALFKTIKGMWPATEIIFSGGPFNFAFLCNQGIATSAGEFILLLNNDVQITHPEWLSEMVAIADLPNTGVVGARLLYPNNTIQHAGFILGLCGKVGSHWYLGSSANDLGYCNRLVARQNLSAVTGACMMISRKCLDVVGMLDDENYIQDCSDIDLCLRARMAGFEVVYTPFATLNHHESASRGSIPEPEDMQIRSADWSRFELTWNISRMVDPHHNPNLDQGCRRVKRAAKSAQLPASRRDDIREWISSE